MTFDICLHEVCVRTGVRYVITKFSGMDGLPNFLTHGAPLRARELRYNCSSYCNAFTANVVDVFRLFLQVVFGNKRYRGSSPKEAFYI